MPFPVKRINNYFIIFNKIFPIKRDIIISDAFVNSNLSENSLKKAIIKSCKIKSQIINLNDEIENLNKKVNTHLQKKHCQKKVKIQNSHYPC